MCDQYRRNGEVLHDPLAADYIIQKSPTGKTNQQLSIHLRDWRTMPVLLSAEQLLDPPCEVVPSDCFANGETDLLHDNEEPARPQCDTVNLVRRPEVINEQQKQEDI